MITVQRQGSVPSHAAPETPSQANPVQQGLVGEHAWPLAGGWPSTSDVV